MTRHDGPSGQTRQAGRDRHSHGHAGDYLEEFSVVRGRGNNSRSSRGIIVLPLPATSFSGRPPLRRLPPSLLFSFLSSSPSFSPSFVLLLLLLSFIFLVRIRPHSNISLVPAICYITLRPGCLGSVWANVASMICFYPSFLEYLEIAPSNNANNTASLLGRCLCSAVVP